MCVATSMAPQKPTGRTYEAALYERPDAKSVKVCFCSLLIFAILTFRNIKFFLNIYLALYGCICYGLLFLCFIFLGQRSIGAVIPIKKCFAG